MKEWKQGSERNNKERKKVINVVGEGGEKYHSQNTIGKSHLDEVNTKSAARVWEEKFIQSTRRRMCDDLWKEKAL